MRPSRQRSCQSFTAAACTSASTALSSRSRGAPSSTIREAPRDDSGGGVVPAASGATAVFVTAGPVATDPDKDAKTRANPRVSKVPLASEMPAATPAAAPTATEATTAELGQRVAPRESLADESPSLFPALAGRACFDRPRRVAPASPIGRQWGEPPPPSAAQRMPVAHDRRGRKCWISPRTLRAAAASRRSERAPAARVFHLPRRERGRGSRTSSGPQSLSLSGGAHVMHQLLPWGKLVWLFSNSCLHRMHVFVAPSMGCVSSVVVVCIPLHPSDSEKRVRVETRILTRICIQDTQRSRQISEPPDSRTRIAELALERWRARRGSR